MNCKTSCNVLYIAVKKLMHFFKIMRRQLTCKINELIFFLYVSEHLNGSSAIRKNSPATNTLMDESQEYLAGVNNSFFL